MTPSYAAVAALAAIGFYAATVPVPAQSQIKNENLLVTVPNGFKVGYRVKKDKIAMTEMIPSSETLQNWTEMLTVHIFFGQRTLTPAAFRANVETRWKQACPGGGAQTLSAAPANGYPALMWQLTCVRNPATGKPENTWFKAIAGGDSFYVVQKAYRSEPTPAQTQDVLTLIGRVSVCDTRRADRACPAGMR
ncbi:MAG: hypothetical protein AB7O50_09115 [Pseudolabrys sp.]